MSLPRRLAQYSARWFIWRHSTYLLKLQQVSTQVKIHGRPKNITKEECSSGLFPFHYDIFWTKTAKHCNLQLASHVQLTNCHSCRMRLCPLLTSKMKGVRTNGTKQSVYCLLRVFSTSVCLLQFRVLLKLPGGGSNMLNGSDNKLMWDLCTVLMYTTFK